MSEHRIQLLLAATASLVVLCVCALPDVPLQIQPYPRGPAIRQWIDLRLPGDFRIYAVGQGRQLRIYPNGDKVLESVPFFNQGRDNTCGQAVSAVVLNYWGYPVTYQQIVRDSNPRNLPTPSPALVGYLRAKGLIAQDYHGAAVENLVAEVNQGTPPIVLLDFGSLDESHYVVVVGYNLKNRTLFLHDSLDKPYGSMPMAEFEARWQNVSLRHLPFLGLNYHKLLIQIQGRAL